MAPDVCFIADAMLGRLARWLRLLGFDTLYYQDIADRDLLKVAFRDDRYILTRDTHFLKRKNVKRLFMLHSRNPLEQVREIIQSFPVKASAESRCTRCNEVLESVDEKESVRDRVPEYVFFSYNSFLHCRCCGSIFWEGTHLKRFRTLIGSVVPAGDCRGEHA